MDRVIEGTKLRETLRQQIADYAGVTITRSGHSRLYFTENTTEQVYCITAPYDPDYRKSDLVIMARIVNDQIIIDVDRTGEPLYEALRQAGIPDEQIILAWKD